MWLYTSLSCSQRPACQCKGLCDQSQAFLQWFRDCMCQQFSICKCCNKLLSLYHQCHKLSACSSKCGAVLVRHCQMHLLVQTIRKPSAFRHPQGMLTPSIMIRVELMCATVIRLFGFPFCRLHQVWLGMMSMVLASSSSTMHQVLRHTWSSHCGT